MGLKFVANTQHLVSYERYKGSFQSYVILPGQGKGDMGEERHWYKEPGRLKCAVG